MCVCVYVCMYMYIYIHTYIHTHTCTHANARVHAYVRVCVFMCVCARVFESTRTCMRDDGLQQILHMIEEKSRSIFFKTGT